MNMVQFHVESWDGRMLGCQGIHPAMTEATPNIDRLARNGTLFENAYCTNPICYPSRANMLSGTFTHKCETWGNFKGLETGMWTYHRGLCQSHDVLLLGKHMDHLTGKHSVLNRVADFLEPLNYAGYPVLNADPAQEYAVDRGTEREYHKCDWEIAEQAVDFIRTRRSDDRAFFISINPNLVHAAFYTNRFWLEHIPAELVDEPFVDGSNHPAEEYQKKSKAWRHGLDRETVRTVRRIYFAMCAEADAIFGKIMCALEKSGLIDETVVIFSSDHGEFALEHQQYCKMSLLEGSVRVPLILHGSGINAGQRIETPVSLIDIAPTICDLAGIEKRNCFDGETLLHLAGGNSLTSRGWALASYSGMTSNTMSWMLRKGDHKLIVHEGYNSRLFNLREDPGELNDVIEQEPLKAKELLAILDREVDRRATLKTWREWRKHNFAQFQRQAPNADCIMIIPMHLRKIHPPIIRTSLTMR